MVTVAVKSTGSWIVGAHLAGGELRVLVLDGADDIGRAAELHQLDPAQPDPHRVVLRAEDRGVTDARNALRVRPVRSSST